MGVRCLCEAGELIQQTTRAHSGAVRWVGQFMEKRKPLTARQPNRLTIAGNPIPNGLLCLSFRSM